MSQDNSTTNSPNTAENKAPTSYKGQLDEVASKVKYPKDENQGGIVNKVAETGKRAPVHLQHRGRTDCSLWDVM